MGIWQTIIASVSPALVVVGALWALFRRAHKSAHHWQQVWNLPAIVNALSAGVQQLTQGAEHTANEIRQLREIVQTRFDEQPPQRDLTQGRHGLWRDDGR